jgi:hypothetical protein
MPKYGIKPRQLGRTNDFQAKIVKELARMAKLDPIVPPIKVEDKRIREIFMANGNIITSFDNRWGIISARPLSEDQVKEILTSIDIALEQENHDKEDTPTPN